MIHRIKKRNLYRKTAFCHYGFDYFFIFKKNRPASNYEYYVFFLQTKTSKTIKSAPRMSVIIFPAMVIPFCNAVQCFSHGNITKSHSGSECIGSGEPSVCHKLVHFVTARASLFTDHRTSCLPMRDKYRNFKDNLRASFSDNSPNVFSSSCLN